MLTHIITVALTLAAGSSGAAPPPFDPSQERDLPRHATPAEAEWEKLRPRIADRGPGGAPAGPVWCPGEYAPADGILLSYHPGYSASILTIVRQMAVAITTTGQARAYIVFGSASGPTTSRDAVLPVLQAEGADMSRIVPVVTPLDSIWIRDYGPRYIYQGNGASGPVRAIVDHTYNRTQRTTDNNFPVVFSNFRKHAIYTLPLIHGGGNYHLDSLGRSHATRLIVNENPGLGESQIIALWQQYQGVNTAMYTPFPTTVDLTQHIDMWMQVLADDKVMISDWPANPGSTQDVICDAAAAALAGAGQQVFRVPARTVGTTHYTYTNVVMCNDLILVPSYTQSTVAVHNAEALAAYQAAMPDKTVVAINCQSIVTLAGVMHCICMHVPKHMGVADAGGGGAAPTALVRSPNGGAGVAYTPGQSVDIRWASDDDLAVANADIQLSFDDGATWPVMIAGATADDGQHTWIVPNYFSHRARIRVTARDIDGRTGGDVSDASFRLAGTCRADFNNANGLTVQDVFSFLAAYFSQDPAADFNDSGDITVQDIFEFLAAYFTGCI